MGNIPGECLQKREKRSRAIGRILTSLMVALAAFVLEDTASDVQRRLDSSKITTANITTATITTATINVIVAPNTSASHREQRDSRSAGLAV